MVKVGVKEEEPFTLGDGVDELMFIDGVGELMFIDGVGELMFIDGVWVIDGIWLIELGLTVGDDSMLAVVKTMSEADRDDVPSKESTVS